MTSVDLSGFKSWKDYIQTVEREKKQLPWAGQNVEPVTRVDTHERKVKERELNPVVMQYIDPHKEEEYYKTRVIDFNDTKRSKVQSLRESKYDIVGHSGPPRKIDLRPKLDKSFNSRQYHIVSNLNHDDHYDSTLLPQAEHLAKARPKPRVMPVRSQQRDFNLITNTFKKNHDEVMTRDYLASREHVLRKYWSTHDYDLVKGEYFSPEKEEQFQTKRLMETQTHGLDQNSKLPPTTRFSEGQSYDIVTNDIIRHDNFTVTSLAATRAHNRIMRTKHVEPTVRASAEKQEDLDEQRRLNRVSYRRWEEGVNRGYDIVLNNDTRALNMTRKPLPQRPQSGWERVTSSSLFGDTLNNEKTSEFMPSITRAVTSGSLPQSATARTTNNDIVKGSVNLSTSREVSNTTAKAQVSGRVNVSVVPSLDVGRASTATAVSYTEPSSTSLPNNALIPIKPITSNNTVRTGGFE